MGNWLFSSIRWIKINLRYKELGQAFNHTDYVMVKMKNFSIIPSDLTFMVSVPEKSLVGSKFNKTGFTVLLSNQNTNRG